MTDNSVHISLRLCIQNSWQSQIHRTAFRHDGVDISEQTMENVLAKTMVVESSQWWWLEWRRWWVRFEGSKLHAESVCQANGRLLVFAGEFLLVSLYAEYHWLSQSSSVDLSFACKGSFSYPLNWWIRNTL